MLVLSRRPNEKILFPSLGVSVEVVNISRNVVRIGVDAPPAVKIVREEIATPRDLARVSHAKSERHETRNHLHQASLAIQLAQRQLQAGLTAEAQETLRDALGKFDALERQLAGNRDEAAPRTPNDLRALVVDDNANESELLGEFLRIHGVNVATARDGNEALDYLSAHERTDAIFLDMRMPRCDGPATIAAIRRNAAYDDVKVFAVSGVDPRECPLPKDVRGVDGWFIKPVNPNRLIEALRQARSRN